MNDNYKHLKTLDCFDTIKEKIPYMLDTWEKEMEWYETKASDKEIGECGENLSRFLRCVYGNENLEELINELTQNATSQTKLYKMKLKFKLTLGLKKINDMTAMCGLSEKAIVPDAITITMTQTVPFVPTDEEIDKYAEIIKDGYKTENFTCEDCKFDGYEYFKEITPKS